MLQQVEIKPFLAIFFDYEDELLQAKIINLASEYGISDIKFTKCCCKLRASYLVLDSLKKKIDQMDVPLSFVTLKS